LVLEAALTLRPSLLKLLAEAAAAAIVAFAALLSSPSF